MLLLTILIAGLIVPALSYSSETVDRIHTILPDNLYVDGVNMGGKTLIEVEKYIDESVNALLSKKIMITSDVEGELQHYEYTLEELGLTTNRNTLKDEISAILNNDLGFMEKYKHYREIEKGGKNYHIEYEMNKEDFMKALLVLDDTTLRQPVNAEFQYEDDQVLIKGGDYGYRFDKEKLYDELFQTLKDENVTALQLDLKPVPPDVTVEDLEQRGIKEKISTFTTTFDGKNKPRSSNVRLAAEIINGKILAPGEIFSFNETVGKRTKERGFKEAGIYVNGTLDTGVGGGICQVSTTLYNAVLLSDLEVIERSNHSLTVPYVPLSRDAAVSWGTKDFKFRNNTDHYMYIHAASTNNTITFDLFSTKSNKTVQLISTVLSKTDAPVKVEEDPTLEMGKEIVVDKGHRGYRSTLTKKVFEDGNLVETEVVSKDRYLTAPKIIKKGTNIINSVNKMED